MNKQAFDEFYAPSSSIGKSAVWEISMMLKISDHLKSAKNGNRESESKLINRLGQVRRHITNFNSLSENLTEVFKEAVEWLRSTGRTVDFTAKDPGYWITARDGKTPRF